jgi:Fe2+ transport system protein FeoA
MVCDPELPAKPAVGRTNGRIAPGWPRSEARDLILEVTTPVEGDDGVDDVLGSPEEWVHLDAIEPSHCGLVASVQAGESEIERLKSMGVCVGRRLMLVRAGDPMIVKVLGSRLGISARLARSVMVIPCSGDAFLSVPKADS